MSFSVKAGNLANSGFYQVFKSLANKSYTITYNFQLLAGSSCKIIIQDEFGTKLVNDTTISDNLQKTGTITVVGNGNNVSAGLIFPTANSSQTIKVNSFVITRINSSQPTLYDTRVVNGASTISGGLILDSSNNIISDATSIQLSTRRIYEDNFSMVDPIGPYKIDAIPILCKETFAMNRFSLNTDSDLLLKESSLVNTQNYNEFVVFVPSNRTDSIYTPAFGQDVDNENNNLGSFSRPLEDFLFTEGREAQVGTTLWNKVNTFKTAITTNANTTSDASRNQYLTAIKTDATYIQLKNNMKTPYKVWNQIKDGSGDDFIFENLLDLSGVALQNVLADGVTKDNVKVTSTSWPIDLSGNAINVLPISQNTSATNGKTGLLIVFPGSTATLTPFGQQSPYLGLAASLGYVVVLANPQPLMGRYTKYAKKKSMSKLFADKSANKFGVTSSELNDASNNFYSSMYDAYDVNDVTTTANGSFARARYRYQSRTNDAMKIFESQFYQIKSVLNKLGLINYIDFNNVGVLGISAGGWSCMANHNLLTTNGATTSFTLNDVSGNPIPSAKPYLWNIKCIIGWQNTLSEVSLSKGFKNVPQEGGVDPRNYNNRYLCGLDYLKVPYINITNDADIGSLSKSGLVQEKDFYYNHQMQTLYQLTKQKSESNYQALEALHKSINIYRPGAFHGSSEGKLDSRDGEYGGYFPYLNAEWNNGWYLPKYISFPFNNVIETGIKDELFYGQLEDLKSLYAFQLMVHRYLGNDFPVNNPVLASLGIKYDIAPTHCDILTDFEFVKVGPTNRITYDASYNIQIDNSGNKVSLSVDASKNLITDATSIQLTNRKLFEDKWTFPYGLGPLQVDAIPMVIKDKFQLPMWSLNQTTDVSGGADVSSNGYQTNTLFDVPACPEVLVLAPSKRTTPEFTNIFRKPSANTCYGPGAFALSLEDFGITYGTEERLGSLLLDASGKRFWERINDFKTACLASDPTSIANRQALLPLVLNHPDYATLSSRVKYPFKVWDVSNNGTNWTYDNLNQLVSDISDNGVPIPLQNDVSGGKYNTLVTRSSWEAFLDASGNSTLLNTTNPNAQSGKLGLLIHYAGSGGAPSVGDSWYFPSLCASLGYVVVCTNSNPIASSHCKLDSTNTLTRLLTDSSSVPTLTSYNRAVSDSPYYISHTGLYGSGRSDYLAASTFYKGSYNIGNQFCYIRSPEVGKINERFMYQIKCILGKLGISNSINYSNVMISGLSAGGNGITTAHRLISENITANIGKTIQFTLNDVAGNSTGTKPYVLTPKALLNWQSVLFDYTQSGKNIEVNRRLLDMNNINTCSITELKVPMITITGDTDLWVPNPFRNTWYNMKYQTIYQNTRKQVLKESVSSNAPGLGVSSALGNILQLSMVLYKCATNHSDNESPYDPSTTRDGITSGTFMSGIGKELIRGWELNQYVSFPATEDVYASGIKSELGYVQFEDIKTASAIQMIAHRFLGKEFPIPASAIASLGMKYDIDPTHLEVATENQYQRLGPISEISYDASNNLTINTPAIKLTSRTVDSSSVVQEGQSVLLSADPSGNLATTGISLGGFKLRIDASGNLVIG